MSRWIPRLPDLAPYATRPADTRGRLFTEPESSSRTVHQRDRDRLLHSAAFRRLKYKTQVFVNSVGDNYRTRLTHTLEVSQIARSIARTLGLNEDLAEALALAHDLGHPCFGHAGERALKECMAPFDGFDHNAQSLRVVTALEHRYADFDGLNLTWETLEGLAKHNGPLLAPGDTNAGALPWAIRAYAPWPDLELETLAGPEAQVAALSDDIAYNAHDIDDGLRAGLITLDDLAGVPLVGPVLRAVHARHPGLEPSRVIHETVRRLIALMIEDLVRETGDRLEQARPTSAAEVRLLGRPVVAFSPALAEAHAGLKNFLFPAVYRHYRVNRMTSKARRVVKDLFTRLTEEPRLLPDDWSRRAGDPGDARTARVVCDYIAGMTDRFALDEHARIFDPLVRP
ncbi:deoxyguanosinetriphosphate triphosphohydrolase [Pararhodospirillum oryzae]|uniref:Deoxyguanosinetriphosphate triphosphohydrolase-like protein n=1 Tax=Pararhodospirillum oryzae TaxID=478448 RepID=A0A512HBG4_9PROT|nr:deoxyguanosinetriphosphate triphosphohydrolase [Pararhodospirillum oryzae]GEO82793.1 deoxyguanosinetriphosphate triphosphohydrolase-like protein [Pararhodospirillum oryzae]